MVYLPQCITSPPHRKKNRSATQGRCSLPCWIWGKKLKGAKQCLSTWEVLIGIGVCMSLLLPCCRGPATFLSIALGLAYFNVLPSDVDSALPYRWTGLTPCPTSSCLDATLVILMLIRAAKYKLKKGVDVILTAQFPWNTGYGRVVQKSKKVPF